MSATQTDWIDLHDACGRFGMTIHGARVAIRRGSFPVPTYKVGRRVVIDRAVLDEFFRLKREEGLRALSLNIKLSEG